MLINLICDNKESWFYNYILDLKKQIESNFTSQVNILDSSQDISKWSDISFFLSCEKIVSKETMKKSNNNIVIHESDLPKWKWMSPLTWQILEWKNIIPITLFEMDEKIDNWNWYIKDNIYLTWYELSNELRIKQYEKTKELIISFIYSYPHNISHKQEWEETIYWRRKPKDSKLDINKSIKEQFNLLRVVDNEKYPAYFEIDWNKYILKIFNE